MESGVRSPQGSGRLRKADSCVISDQDLATEDSESQDDEIENDQSHAGLTANMLADHSLSNTSSYDSALPLAGLTNEALLEMKEAWKEIARQKGKDYAASHPHCRKVLIELVARGMAD